MSPEEREFVEHHADADIIYDTETSRVVGAVYPEWHPWGRLQRFLWAVKAEEELRRG